MVKIIAVHNQKGGVGKTTTTTNVGFELARKGYKVLLADVDPQATLTSALGVTDSEETVFSALQGAVDGKETRLPWIRLQENISLCPSCRKMADAEYLLQNEYGRENFLKELAARTDGGYDFVLLDCPPAVGLITVNALVAATDLIIPVQPEVASLYGLVSILDTVAVIQRKINRGLNLLGMLVTWENLLELTRFCRAEHQTVPHTPLRRRGRKGKHWPEPHWSIRWNCTAR